VSSQNDCYFCQTAHGALAAYHLEGDENLVFNVKRDFESAAISEKLKALLPIAGKVQQGSKNVLPAIWNTLGVWAQRIGKFTTPY
jgi:hypothetical protein